MNKITESAAQYFDAMSDDYESSFSDESIWSIAHQIAWHLLMQQLSEKAPARVVDTGCGTGKWGRHFLNIASAIDFADVSEQMLSKCIALATEKPSTTQVRAFHAGVEKMVELDDNTYDLTLCMGDPLSYTSDAASAINELVRIAAPNGLILVSVDARLGYLRIFRDKGNYDLDDLDRFLASGDVVGWEDLPIHAFTANELSERFKTAGASPIWILELPKISSYFLFDDGFKEKLRGKEFRDRLLALELKYLQENHAVGSHHLYGLFRKGA